MWFQLCVQSRPQIKPGDLCTGTTYVCISFKCGRQHLRPSRQTLYLAPVSHKRSGVEVALPRTWMEVGRVGQSRDRERQQGSHCPPAPQRPAWLLPSPSPCKSIPHPGLRTETKNRSGLCLGTIAIAGCGTLSITWLAVACWLEQLGITKLCCCCSF